MTIDSTVEDKISFGWGGSASALIDSVETEIVTCLKQKHEELQEDTASRSQVIAWESSLRSTKNAVAQLIATNQSYNNIGVIFEYELPRERGRRPDILLLTGEQILVLEFKEHSYPSRAFIDQVAAYARDIKNYHAASHELTVRPLLVLSNAQDLQEQHDDVEIVSANELSSVLEKLITVPPKKLVDWSAWAGADYSPLPTIVAAARQLFLNESLPAIRRAQSAGIPETIRKLVEISNNSRTEKEKHLVLITGVPGAGKTLAGLQLVYENFFGDSGSERTAVFLSGNGPLVEVLQHALDSKVFVQDVHGFLRQYGGNSSRVPDEHIWVFDEAQRAWDAQRVGSKRGKVLSEPEDFLSIGEKKTDWAVMIGLIGEGQEIHLGEEAGLTQWADAVEAMPSNWTVHCPSHISSLFSSIEKVRICPELNLNTSLRTHLAEDLQDWVKLLLAGEIRRAGELSERIHAQGFCMYLTRDLDTAKKYVRDRYAESKDKRYGLIASSKAKHLPKHGVLNDFQSTRRVKKGPWYNDDPNSKSSCCQLEEVVTEFACQGLELDLPIVCWGGDLAWIGDEWVSPAQPRSKAQDPHNLRINSYRVLLTRGRDGFIIFVPNGSAADETANVLQQVGVRLIDDDKS